MEHQGVPGSPREHQGAPGSAGEHQGAPGSTREHQGALGSISKKPYDWTKPKYMDHPCVKASQSAVAINSAYRLSPKI